jgi:outer membrane protein insertion porin family
LEGEGCIAPRLAFAWVLLFAILPLPAAAQALRLSPDAEVRSIDFRFTGPHELYADELAEQMNTRAPDAFHTFQSAVAWVPFVPNPDRHAFDPVRLQEDVARLRRYYRRQGFPEARVDYTVGTDDERRRVAVAILVEEGPALRLRELSLVAPYGTSEIGAPELRQEIQARWQTIRARHVGKRFSEPEIIALRGSLESFLGDRGYIRAKVDPRATIDSTAHQVDLVCLVDTGARARVSDIRVEGVTKVDKHIVARQLGFETGDWMSRRGLEKARENLMSVDLFRTARLNLGEGSPADSSLPVQVVVREDRPRFTQIEGGYATDGAGLTGQVRWTHPNFTGGARSLNAVALVQSGVWATSDIKDRLLRGTLLLNQPYVFLPALSMGFGPSFELRDGHLDRSAAWTLQNTLVYRFSTLQSAALRYEYTYRKVDESNIQDLSPNSTLAESLAVPVRTSLISLNTSLGRLDDFGRPRHGVVVKPNLSITAPSAWGSVEFARLDVQATAFAPLPGRANAVMLRGKIGQVWPFGKSVPTAGENPAVELLRIRDFTLTAGGAEDVRGYATRMLGPKVPSIEREVSGTDTTLTSDHYVEAGGLRRWTGSVELRLGLRRLSKDVFAHLFFDAGQVWTSDSRFEFSDISETDEDVHYATGAGLGYYTAVGAIRFDAGYKLNPSVFDLRDPQDVLNAALAGRDPATAPVKSFNRYAFHLSLGLYF